MIRPFNLGGVDADQGVPFILYATLSNNVSKRFQLPPGKKFKIIDAWVIPQDDTASTITIKRNGNAVGSFAIGGTNSAPGDVVGIGNIANAEDDVDWNDTLTAEGTAVSGSAPMVFIMGLILSP